MADQVFCSPMNPDSFLERSALVYPDKPAVLYGDQRFTYAQFNERVNRLAGALSRAGVTKGDRVAYMVPNTPPMLEAHFGPLRLGAVLVAVNIRLAARETAHILNHSGAKVLVFDSEFAPTVRRLTREVSCVTTWVQVVDSHPGATDIPGPEYEAFLASAPAVREKKEPDSEFDTIAINYTSGTTGTPKGVQYSFRGAYLNALADALEVGLNAGSVYLWTLPMFHCNGWCFTWAVTAAGGTHVCLRRADPAEIYRLIREKRVTHMCCAPTVLASLYTAPEAEGRNLSGLTISTGGAPPAPQVLRTMEGMGAFVHHLYGLTETYGPCTVCALQPGDDGLPFEERARRRARQGVPHTVAGTAVRVVDPLMNDVPGDGETMGEVVMRGNTIMSGYYKEPEATARAFEGGWFHSGDLAVRHPDGYIELKDRAKDVIISGGENISSLEVEKVIMEHPAVLEVCVIGVPDTKWGEVPKAFVSTRPGATVTEDEIIRFTRDRIARFKAPKRVAFGDLPKTATGKIQKFLLRDREWEGYEGHIHGSGTTKES